MEATSSSLLPKSSDSQTAVEKPHPGRERGSSLNAALFWGGAAMAGFYAAIPYLPVYSELLRRYFCGHPIGYVLAGLFFFGMAILLVKSAGTAAEYRALESGLLDDPELTKPSDLQIRALRTEEKLESLPDRAQHTAFAIRVRDACRHVRARKSAAGLNDHLKYLADVAAERLHGSYALVRTITWAVPILGFLGTVIGITLAISNLTPEQLDTSLNAVTGGLGVAFDTTALALALSVVLVFTSFMVERAEQRILSRAEDIGVKHLTALFPETAPADHPLADAELKAAQKLISQTDSLIHRQTELWNDALESTRSKWLEVMESQKQNFDATLRDGMQATLDDHVQQLAATRADFLTAFQSAAGTLHETMADSRTLQREMQQEFGEQFGNMWHNVQGEMRSLQEDQQNRMERFAADLSERVAGWQEQLRLSTDSSREQIDELKQQRETLLQLSAQEERLAGLQHRLTENLEAIRSTESFEETLHSLSAAVHLLTARARPKAA